MKRTAVGTLTLEDVARLEGTAAGYLDRVSQPSDPDRIAPPVWTGRPDLGRFRRRWVGVAFRSGLGLRGLGFRNRRHWRRRLGLARRRRSLDSERRHRHDTNRNEFDWWSVPVPSL